MLSEIKKQLNEAINRNRLREFKVEYVIVVDENKKVVGVSSFFDIWKKSDVKFKNICIIGMGFVGLTLGVSLADIGFNIIGIDDNQELLNDINSGKTPFHEKNLDYFLKRNINKNLFLSHQIKNNDNNIYIICVGTPVDTSKKANLNAIKSVVEDISKFLKEGDLVIVRSTVPVGTCRNVIIPILEEGTGLICGKDYYLAFAPERTVEGRALEELKTLPQVIGGFSKNCLDNTSNFFRTLAPHIVAVDSLEEAEMVKLINNSFRDVSFAFSNELVYICDKFNLNTAKIIKAAIDGYDRNKIPLPGFVGGYCLKKDPYIYAKSAEEFNLLSKLVINSREINENLPVYAFNKIEEFSTKNKKNKIESKIFIIGLAYKGVPETSDMRFSPALDFLELLRNANWKNICGYDPVVKKEEIEKNGIISCSLEEGFDKAEIIIVTNNNPYYNEIDVVSLLQKVKKPCLFFDGWSMFDPKEILKVEGIVYQGLGFREE